MAALAWIGVAVMTVFFTAWIWFLYWVHPLVDPQRRLLHRIASWWGRGLVSLAPGSRVRIIGGSHIPHGRPVIFMANHQSYVDVPTLFYLPGQFKWMADVELFRIPIFGWAMRMAGYIPVQRGDPRSGIRSLERAKGWLREGISIFIFPEGTRSRSGILGRFQTGGFRLALSAGVPIVPVVVAGTRQLLPRGSWIFRWGIRIQIRILEPVLPPSERSGVRRFMEQVRSRMREGYQREIRQLR